MSDVRKVKCTHPGCTEVLEVDVAEFPAGDGRWLFRSEAGNLLWFRDHESGDVDKLTFRCKEHLGK